MQNLSLQQQQHCGNMTRTDIINHLFETKLGYKKSYLEIGLFRPDLNYYNVFSANKESVDPFTDESSIGDEEYKNFVLNNVLTYRMTSDEFFNICNKKYDLIFIDGLHIAEQVVKDIVNSYNHLNPGGYLVIHDCLPYCEARQTDNPDELDVVLQETDGWNGTTWKAIPNLYKAGLNFYTVDADEGCCVVKYDGPKDFSNYTVTNLSYNDVFSNLEIRDNILHVISENEYINI